MWKEWVLDVTLGYQDGLWCFCPIEGDINSDDCKIITGMNLLSDKPPGGGKVVGIVHADGQEAVEEFCQKYAKELQRLQDSLRVEKENDGCLKM